MRTIVKGKNLDVAEDDRRFVASKMERLERFLDDRSEAVVELSVEHHRDADDTRIVEVSLRVDGHPLRAVARAVSWKAATDEVIDRMQLALFCQPFDSGDLFAFGGDGQNQT